MEPGCHGLHTVQQVCEQQGVSWGQGGRVCVQESVVCRNDMDDDDCSMKLIKRPITT